MIGLWRIWRLVQVALIGAAVGLGGCGSDGDGDGDGSEGGAGGGGGGSGGGDPGTPTCDAYCDQVMTNCKGDLAVYASPDICLGLCAKMPVGELADVAGNTLGCRLYHSGAAEMDAATHCPHAGPGGAGFCGADCESFCSLSGAICSGLFPDEETCMTACEAFPTDGPFNANIKTGDTIECRLYHLSVASVDNIHCGHIGEQPPAGTCADE